MIKGISLVEAYTVADYQQWEGDEVVSPRTSRRDKIIKLELYEREGVPYYGLAYPEAHKVKLYQLTNGRYLKVGDFQDQPHRFDLSKCTLEVDFSSLWPGNR